MAEPEAGRPVLHAMVAEFDDVGSVTRAAKKVRDAGYQHFDVFSPFPIHGIDRAMGVRPTRLPWIVLCCGLTGAASALFFQWWSNGHDYPFKISAKPLFGIPANIPVTFEFTILLSAFAAFFGMLLLNRLPQHHHALFELPNFRRATDDGFFLAIEATDPHFEAHSTRALLESLSTRPVLSCDETPGRAVLPPYLRAAFVGLAVLGLLPFGGAWKGRAVDSTKPAFHLVPDMDSQARFRAQAANAFFADGRAMRPEPLGTVAFETAVGEDAVVRTGKVGEAFCERMPVTFDRARLERGRQRYDIYCSACHGYAGYGDGLVARRAQDLLEPDWVPPASLHDPLVRGRADGQIFDTIRNGVRTMPAYGAQVSVDDAWSIVAYVRALQRSQDARLADLSPEERAALPGR